MSKYIQVEFKDISRDQSDLLIALLNEIGFDGFEEEQSNLKAFIPEANFDKLVFQQSIKPFQINFSETIIEETNWNQLWESSFEPVVVEDFVAVRANFHEPLQGIKHEIIITPKMSFGTGHHATTYMMLQQMEYLNFRDKSVFDFGTGTGVLAILAEKLGAKKVLAIDNDEWSIENANENIKRNSCGVIDLQFRNTADAENKFNIIIANINKNIILENLEFLEKQLLPGGILLLSGLLTTDEKEILSESNKLGLKFDLKTERHNWLFVKLSHL
ncbi:MAG: 50S ribosomal protein L11 methyltransferase [Chitinophagaceae bacterium]